ncbi:MAG: hypothetical protein JSS07_06005 [Proteobacteria bacterium]|nr:hypothetical protein [Pseudomonadota bacterium]
MRKLKLNEIMQAAGGAYYFAKYLAENGYSPLTATVESVLGAAVTGGLTVAGVVYFFPACISSKLAVEGILLGAQLLGGYGTYCGYLEGKAQFQETQS